MKPLRKLCYILTLEVAGRIGNVCLYLVDWNCVGQSVGLWLYISTSYIDFRFSIRYWSAHQHFPRGWCFNQCGSSALDFVGAWFTSVLYWLKIILLIISFFILNEFTSLFLNVYFHLFESRDIQREMFHPLVHQILKTSTTGPGWIQELRTQFRSPTWMTGTQVMEPLSAT